MTGDAMTGNATIGTRIGARMPRRAALRLGAGLGLGALVGPSLFAPRPATAAGLPMPMAEQSLARLVNVFRMANGLGALGEEARLSRAARMHAADMATGDFFDHAHPAGTQPKDRVLATGYSFSVLAENIAGGQRDAETVIGAWEASPPHRETLLLDRGLHLGVGVVHRDLDPGAVDLGWYWVLLVAAPSEAPEEAG